MNFDLPSILWSLPAIVIGLTVHEYAHAWAAFRLGDSTAKDGGRLSLNPLRHIDPLGFVFLLAAGFGWAKPVRFSRENLGSPRRDEALVAVAGPLSNLGVALLASVLLRILVANVPALLSTGSGGATMRILLNLVYINYGLFIFNLIPIPPLDGSHLLFGALSLKPETEGRIYRYGSLALLAVILIDSRTKLDLLPIGKLVRGLAGVVFRILGF
jgi:Zn-dependent protease